MQWHKKTLDFLKAQAAAHKEIWTFCKAQVTAQIASLVDFSIAAFLKYVCGIWYLYSNFTGSVCGGIVNCAINYRWAFRAQGQSKLFVAIKYFIVWSGSISLNNLGTYLLTEWWGVDDFFLFAKAIVSLFVGFFWNYLLQRFFVYRNVSFLKRKTKTEHEL